ncbi:MAG: hypothetical protein IIC76_13735, partial [Bacteroidetes bacterium]|nr:hypothetical protein [Bacteroidota bacterium]
TEFVNSERIDISGTIPANNKIFLFVNGIKQRKHDPESEGKFSFNNVELSLFKIPNVIFIEAQDANGNKFGKTFNVIVDTTIPEIKLPALKTITTESSISLKGTISETADIVVLAFG